MTYVLIVIMHVGALGSGNSNSIATQEFSSAEACMEAGKKAMSLVNGTTKEIAYACVKK